MPRVLSHILQETPLQQVDVEAVRAAAIVTVQVPSAHVVRHHHTTRRAARAHHIAALAVEAVLAVAAVLAVVEVHTLEVTDKEKREII